MKPLLCEGPLAQSAERRADNAKVVNEFEPQVDQKQYFLF